MEDEPINQNYLIGCDTIENSPSFNLCGQKVITDNSTLGYVTKVPSANENMNKALNEYLLHMQKIDARKFECDACQMICESETLLGMHKIFNHSG